ncbi:PLP-dependent aminotransferase family protein [Treponema sp.]
MRIDTIVLETDTENPLYLKLAEALKRAILSGNAEAGERLPSVRRLSDAVGVNPATVVAAYRILEKEGYVLARAGSGIYVRGKSQGDAEKAEAEALAELNSEHILLAPGTIDMAALAPSPDLFPVDAFKILVNEVLERDGGYAFGYQESSGWPPLRHALAQYLQRSQNIIVDGSDLSVISGAQQGIDLCAKALLSPQDVVVVEAPTYRGALAVFWSRGAETIGLPLEAEGLDLDALENICKKKAPRLVYVIPRYQNPTTISWRNSRMQGLLDLASRYDFRILEDDLLSDLYYGERREPSCLKAMDTEDRVIYIRSFSKVLMPGLRLGVLVPPRSLRFRFEAAKRASDIATDGLVQRTLELYLSRGYHNSRLDFLRSHYGAIYAQTLNACQKYLLPLGVSFDAPEGGLNLWVRLPEPIRGSALRAAALERGVALVNEAVYGQDPQAKDEHVRISFASLSASDAEQGIRLIAEALGSLQTQSQSQGQLGVTKPLF